jgi:hypothetical protein
MRESRERGRLLHREAGSHTPSQVVRSPTGGIMADSGLPHGFAVERNHSVVRAILETG